MLWLDGDRMLSGNKARLYTLADGMVYLTDRATRKWTRRHAGVVLFSLDGAAFTLQAGGRTHRHDAFLVRPGVARLLDARCPIASVHVDPSHRVFPAFCALPTATGVVSLETGPLAEPLSTLCAARNGCAGAAELAGAFDSIVAAAGCALPGTGPRDPRIVLILEQLASADAGDLGLGELARTVGVSASRFSHLFSDSVGLSLRSFRQWQRIRSATEQLGAGERATAIAHASGFSDAAHLSRTFQQALGLPPSFFARPESVEVSNVRA